MIADRLSDFFGVDDDYVRPRPDRSGRTDGIIAAALSIISLATAMYLRDVQPSLQESLPVAGTVAAVLSGGVLISLRRQFPVAVLLLASGLHFIVVGITLPLVASLAAMQVLYFLGIYTSMAYARNRQALAYAVGLVLSAMVVWLVASNSYYRAALAEFRPTFWYYLGTVVLNLAYFGAAIWLGQQAWLQARDTEALAASRELVKSQAAQLAERAVDTERLRIARDLHDSVAHHISLIGIQTAAARRAMGSHPQLAADAMMGVEAMTRDAISDLHSILGSLREASDGTGPQTIESLAALTEEASQAGLRVSYQVVGDEKVAASITPIQAGQLLRIAREAIANIRTHSTATEARIVLRVGDGTELEVTDNGHPLPNTGGSGLGHIGIRERIASLGGTAEIGPRPSGGYRVRVTIPNRRSP